MDFFDLVDISERYMELVNPSSVEKILRLGKFLRLQEGSQVIDFGCGFAEPLVLWAETFGIQGVGIEIRSLACERAREKVVMRNLATKLEIVCMDASRYQFEAQSYDAATCLGASFIFGGFQQTIQALAKAIKPGGRMAIGEPYWKTSLVPPDYAQKEIVVHTETELYRIARDQNFDFEYLIRASQDDWDRYEADNWHGLVRWLEDNPIHPEREEVHAHLNKIQEEYFSFGREFLGWEMIVLAQKL
jgi:SAM-dependent methyltransferase